MDDLFAYDGPLGANAIKDGVSINLWAPTAQVLSYSYSCFFQTTVKVLVVWMLLKF